MADHAADNSLTWEDCVNQVCILGDPDHLKRLAGEWDLRFRRAATVADALRDGKRDLENTFVGPAGDAFREKLDSLIQLVAQIEDDHKPALELLHTASSSLAEAQAKMPVPIAMLSEVKSRSEQANTANMVGWGIAGGAALTPLGVILLPAGIFASVLTDKSLGELATDLAGSVKDSWDDRNDEKTNEARSVQAEVNDKHAGVAAVSGGGTAYDGKYSGVQGIGAPSGSGAAGSAAGGVSGLGSGGDFDTSSVAAGGSPSKFNGLGTGGYVGAGFDPTAGASKPGALGSADSWNRDSWIGSGLAGAGDGGFQAASGGALGSFGGLGGGSGAMGAGVGGVGSLGGGGAGGGLGPAMSDVAGGGVVRPGATGGGAGVGMMGAGGGAGAPAAGGEERSTWLEEDEDVWGLGDQDDSSLGWSGA